MWDFGKFYADPFECILSFACYGQNYEGGCFFMLVFFYGNGFCVFNLGDVIFPLDDICQTWNFQLFSLFSSS